MFFVAVTRSNANAQVRAAPAPWRMCVLHAPRARSLITASLRLPLARAQLVFAFLYAMLDIFKGYFEEDFDEDSIRDNFTLVYELLDGASAREAALRGSCPRVFSPPWADRRPSYPPPILRRDPRLRLPTELCAGRAEDVH